MIYVIFDMKNAASIDFSQVEETSLDTLRLSVDETKTVLKFKGNTPSYLVGLKQYNHKDILAIMHSSDWTKEEI